MMLDVLYHHHSCAYSAGTGPRSNSFCHPGCGTRRSVLQLLIRGMLRVHSEQLSGWFKWPVQGFPGGSVVKTPSASAGDVGSIPGLGRALMLRNK